MEQLTALFNDKKKGTLAFLGICAAALFFILVAAMAKSGESVSGQKFIAYLEFANKSSFFVLLFYMCPGIAAAITLFKNDKKTRWIAGAVLFIPVLFFFISKPSEGDISMGVGTILYLIASLCYFGGNYLTKE